MIIIMAEEPLTIFKETSIPYIGANAFSEATVHSFKLVSIISSASELELAVRPRPQCRRTWECFFD